MDLLSIVKSVAFGGCSATPLVRYSIVGHDHLDHLVRDTRVTIVGPVRVRRSNVLYIAPGDHMRIRLEHGKLDIWVLGLRDLRQFRINRRLHSFPVVLKHGQEYAIYVDDLDIDDIELIRKLISELKRSLGDLLKIALLPVYNRSKQHGSKDPRDLHDKSIELLKFAHSLRLDVIALAHPVIPSDLPKFAIPFRKILQTLK